MKRLWPLLTCWAVLVAALLTPIAASAQDTTRLPAIIVRETPLKPGARTLVGVVKDTGAFAIDSVEISIAGIKRRTLSGADGRFRFDDIGPGTYTVRARRIGWAPQVRSFTVDSLGGTGSFELVPLIRMLEPVVSNGARPGLSGVVGDSAFHQIVGADVHLMGRSRRRTTDSLGQFYIPDVPAGSYMLSISRDGYAPRLMSVTVPKDSGRRVMVFLGPARPTNLLQSHNLTDLAARLAWRLPSRSAFLTRDDMIAGGYDWVMDAVHQHYVSVVHGAPMETGCWAVVNGGPDAVELASLTVDDVESVEIYPATNSLAPRRARGRAAFTSPGEIPTINAELARFHNQGQVCPLTVVWLRN